MAEFVNIAAYKFVELDDLANRKQDLLPRCRAWNLKGTILVSSEGINLFLAGSRENVDSFLSYLRGHAEFADLAVKESLSDDQPFSRMLVRIKKEIISMGVDAIRPRVKTSPKLSAAELKSWLDEGRPITLLDVRNDYEIEVGTFRNAIPAGIDHFRRFPEATGKLPDSLKSRPLVMFCTGGIRCEKAGPLMEQQGFTDVYQLDGGILKYFEDCGGDHYDGDCFVFDKRVAVNPQLEETEYQQCFACQSILTAEQQASPHYHPPDVCPVCYRSPEQQQRELLEDRDRTFAQAATPLPGSVAYDNVRPMNVPLRFDQFRVVEFLSGMHAHLTPDYWESECQLGRICHQSRPLAADATVRAGWRIEHLVPQTVEPDVSTEVTFLYEDDQLIAINKPAPLPMHACGRFNRNSLQYLLAKVFPEEQLRILHRLDANTTGVVLFARTRSIARQIHHQFLHGLVAKEYLARVHGHPDNDQFACHVPIADQAELAGARVVDEAGLASTTEFSVVQRLADGTTLVKCFPKTGRTNQIRLHLSHLGFPIVGDPTYQAGGGINQKQTLSVEDPPMCLHASSLQLKHPETGQPMAFNAPDPEWFGS